MKSDDMKQEFIKLRAEGKSYRAIAEQLGISKNTCAEWEKALSDEVSRLRQENLEALYSEYGMMREARIRRLGDTLSSIDAAIEKVDLSTIAPEKLLDLRLKYAAAIRDEYRSSPSFTGLNGTSQSCLEAVLEVYRRSAAGEISTDQAKTELQIIDKAKEAYERNNPILDFSL